MHRPSPLKGLRHIALLVHQLEACEKFYVDLLGMKVVWRPDADNLYLTSHQDNLALHRATHPFRSTHLQKLDHIGFFLETRHAVDQWHDYLCAQQVVITAPPKDHRDGSRSFYCRDPEGTVVQMIFIDISA